MEKNGHRDEQVVADFSQEVRNALGQVVRAVHWFGSRARRSGSPDSDFDLLVETAAPLSAAQRDRVLDITLDISAEHDCLLDVHYYTTEELESAPYARTPFVERVREEALAI